MSSCLTDTPAASWNSPCPGSSFVASWLRARTERARRSPFVGPRRLVAAWLRRRQLRRDLQRLPDHLLRDIGLDVAETRRESAKPFWTI